MSVEAWKRIKEPLTYPFPVEKAGLYAISITASCRSGKQINRDGGEDLHIEIDGVTFREIPEFARKQTNNIAASWNGTNLQGLSKTIIFIAGLKAGQHKLHLIPHLGAEVISEPTIKSIDNSKSIIFSPNAQAEEGDRRPWYAVTLVDLPLVTFTIEATARWRKRDSDDIKIVIDGQTKENTVSAWRRAWYWLGSVFKQMKQERQQHTFEENLPKKNHSIELWADRQPTLHKIELDLGEIILKNEDLIPGKRIPTVDDPEWTGDFKDDTEQMILARAIFGEARNEILSDEARIGVGWSIRRRVEDPRWGDTYGVVITQPKQYAAFKTTDANYEYVKNPLWDNSEIDKKSWLKCYKIAGQVMRGEVTDPVQGSNHYHDISQHPFWAMEEAFIMQIDRLKFYKL